MMTPFHFLRQEKPLKIVESEKMSPLFTQKFGMVHVCLFPE